MSLVSVIIAAHDADRWIEQTLTSALAQTHRDIEVIVVDDSSTDDTARIAFEVAKLDSRVRILSQPHAGPSRARNRALGEARGSYIQYLDADDLLGPTKIADQLARLESAQVGCIATSAWSTFSADPATGTRRQDHLWMDSEPVDWLVSCQTVGGTMPVNSFLIPRAVCDLAGPWNESLLLAEDAEYLTRVILRSRGILFCSSAMAYVRVGHSSRSGNKSELALRSEYEALTLIGKELLAAENSVRTRHATAHVMQRFAHTRYPQVKDLVSAAESFARELGVTQLSDFGGRWFRWAAQVLGWRAARRLQHAREAFRRPKPKQA